MCYRSKNIALGIMLILSVLALGGCSQKPKELPLSIPTTINDIAHDVDKRLGFTVYIAENGEYIPYFVLTNNYNNDGNCLLLRQHLLDDNMIYIDNISHSYDNSPSYYETSDIDKFLNNEFLETLSSISNKIIDSEIVITADESIGHTGEDTLSIRRKVFLLSYTETGGPKSYTSTNEGVLIECFRFNKIPISIKTSSGTYTNNDESRAFRIATTASGESQDWWLRTPETWDANMVLAILFDGKMSSSPVSAVNPNSSGIHEDGNVELGVRPAFCLSPDTAIYEDVVDGEKRYFISLE